MTTSILALGPDDATVRTVTLDALPALLADPKTFVWVDILDPGEDDRKMLEDAFRLHPLSIEDMLACGAPELRPGDVVLVRTGWYNVYFADQGRYNGAWPGITTETAQWLADQDVCIVGADTVGVEVLGGSFGKEGFACPVHGLLIRDYGIHLLELMHLEELAAAGVTEFCFMLAPLRITGATASPVNPLALI